MSIAQVILYIGGPFLFLRFSNLKIINTLSPVVCCYLLGVGLGNIPGLSLNMSIAKEFAELSVPLAIPLLLLPTDLIRWTRLAKSTVISFVLILVCVLIVSFSASFLFVDLIPEHWKIAGMLVGVYTGGTPNMTAIGQSLSVTNEVFVLMNGADLILGGLYLLFILSFGHRLIGKFLMPFSEVNKAPLCDSHDQDKSQLERKDFFKLSRLAQIKRIVLLILISVIFLGISAGFSLLILKTLHPALVILGITTLGIAFSFNQKARSISGSYELGEFLLLVFCVAVGSMANIQNLANASFDYLAFAGIVMVGSITLHVILCRFFKIDKDTAIITSIAGVFGPPFVAPMAQALGNREVIISGLTSGLVGYAVGNYLGIALAYFVRSFI